MEQLILNDILPKMPIVSMSLDDSLLGDIDTLTKLKGYKGRSDFLRTALNTHISEEKKIADIQGKIEGVIVIVNEEKNSEEVSKLLHHHQSLIKTQLHNHTDAHKCVYVCVVHGEADKIKAFVNMLKSSPKIDYTNLTIA